MSVASASVSITEWVNHQAGVDVRHEPEFKYSETLPCQCCRRTRPTAVIRAERDRFERLCGDCAVAL